MTARRKKRAARGARDPTHAGPPPGLPSMHDARKLFLDSRRYHEAGSRDDLNFQFTTAIVALGRRWRNRLNEELAAIGQTQARWESLFWIEIANGRATQRELAQRVGIEGPTFARMLDRLEKERLVERRVSKWDRRTKTIALRKDAAPRLKEMSELTDRLRRRLLADVEPADLETCIAVIRRILARLQTL